MRLIGWCLIAAAVAVSKLFRKSWSSKEIQFIVEEGERKLPVYNTYSYKKVEGDALG